MCMKFNEFNYNRPDLDIFKKDYQENIDQIKNANSVKEALEGIHEIQALQNEINTQSELAEIRFSINTKDAFYKKASDFWNEQLPIISEWETDYYRAILNSPFLSELKQEIAALFFDIIENSLKVFDPTIIPLLQQENKLVSEYDSLIASAEIDYKGETYNLSGLTPFMQSTDRQERKATSELYANFFQENLADFDRIYDELVKVRHEMATSLGFKDFVEMGYARMNRLDYTRSDVEVFRREVLEQIVPLSTYIYDRQAKRLELDELKYYDLNLSFPTGNAKPIGTAYELIQKAEKMYSDMSPETADFFDFMVKHDLMDLLTKPGKQSGGYCTHIPNFNAPFIFANFNGTSGDVDVLTHEAGHAFQLYRSRWINEPELIWPTHESCEIHSMSMEFIAWPYMDEFFGDKVEKYKYAHLSEGVTFLPYGVLVDHFQHEIYENPTMTPEERRSKWRELEKQYTPWKEYDDNEFYEQGGLWFRQGHIFNSPFYYIDYTLAQVCAFQFWERSHVKDDDSFWSDYLNICRVGGTKSFQEIVKLANLKSPFEENSLSEVTQAIQTYLEAIDEEQLI